MAAAFSSLPPELIVLLWSHVLEPRDVESFALVSRNIFALAGNFLQEHKRLKNQFSILWYEHEGPRRGSSPANFLVDLLTNPRAALYVEQIGIEGYKRKWDNAANIPLNMSTNYHLPYPPQTMQLFEEAVKTSAFIPDSEAAEWISEIRKGDERNILALTITLLPNVRLFGVDSVPAGGCRLAEMVRQIGLSQNSTALSRLTTVRVGWSDLGGNDFNWVLHFSSLKTVKSIQGSLVSQSDTGMDYSFALPTPWSNVKSLDLDECSIKKKHLFIYLQCINALETVYYRAAGQAKPYDPFWLCTGLAAYAGHSLKTLQILSDDGTGSHMGSLAGLSVLTELRTEYSMLLNYETGLPPEKLMEMLPPSIEKVVLKHNDRYDLGLLQCQILEMCKLKKDRLPNLKLLKFWVDYDTVVDPNPRVTFKAHHDGLELIKELKKRSMEVGVELHIEQFYYEIRAVIDEE